MAKDRLIIPGRPTPPEHPRQAYVTAHQHNRAMEELDRALRSADTVLAAQQAAIADLRQRFGVLVARHEALERLLCQGEPVTRGALEREAQQVVREWQALAEAEQAKADGAPAPDPPDPDNATETADEERGADGDATDSPGQATDPDPR